ncbi:EutN/CcmL family microcompartment protein [Carboxydothermus pertinax]|uniref:Ethanolamine utilization protein EutN n=1 Tax=Carboxydothermus pertinax TaxID=870242 RepID=A0A1L8CSM8_9THEO|nr:EutN/CcmL family microcompartment protein [Carboxydothermus pertinax]GAV21923.1 ethanolamine utilization protein EutN [Carboxydothermus pertinax]
MLLGKIIGNVVATRKDETLVGTKMLVTQPVDLEGNPVGQPFVAVDTVGAGIGELVLYVTGSVAPFAVRRGDVPIDAAIVGIVDKLEWQRS